MYVLQHAYTDGRLEEPTPVAILHFHADDGGRERARNIGLVLSTGLVMQILCTCNLIEILVTFQVGILAQPVTSVGKPSNH